MGEPVLAERAPAKVNLFLHVLERRLDGLHALDSLIVFADICDRVSLVPGGEPGLEVTGPFSAALDGDGDNLILRADRALRKAWPGARGGRFHLVKNLPVAAGIGGGSADAGAALRLMARLNPDLPPGLLPDVAAGLGADVPACLASRPLWLEGAGEGIGPGPALPPLHAVLANPGIALATAQVFARLGLKPGQKTGRKAVSRPAALGSADEVAAFLSATVNDLERAAAALAPAIATARDALAACAGCLMARMSGSGATVFGLFKTQDAAQEAAATLASAHPAWWVTAAVLNPQT